MHQLIYLNQDINETKLEEDRLIEKAERGEKKDRPMMELRFLLRFELA